MLIVFDLDGTLIDSSKDLAISVNASRNHMGLTPLDPAVIHDYVGNGAAVLIRRAMGPDASSEQVEEALRFFLSFYREHALENTRLYPGIREIVEQLSAEKHALAVLTNKPVRISFDIIGALGLQPNFFRVYGGDSFEQKKPDPVGIRRLMEEAGLSAAETMMVGDSGVDIQTARNAGVRSCGVAWGFKPESFIVDTPDFLIQCAPELLALVQ